ncbi:MAG: hypothetical protein H7X71_07525 [Chitinophagales bacterium]|nr:hypothetical protein [Chitinophagales bacterium]
MQNLHPNWLTEGHIDFEYKKYILLAYLQSATLDFNDQKIYPFLSDLVFHYRNLIALKENTEITEKQFPKKLSRLDFENFALQFEKMTQDDFYIEEMQSIIAFAIPKIAEHIQIAKEIYDEVDSTISIYAIGIIPLHVEEGYLLIKTPLVKETHVFQYELTIFENTFEKFRGLKTEFIHAYPDTFFNYEEAIKSDLIRTHKQFPNPATYLIQSNKPYPFPETFFPVAKRRFVRFLAQGMA